MKKWLMAAVVSAALGTAGGAAAAPAFQWGTSPGGGEFDDTGNAFAQWFGAAAANSTVKVLEQGTLSLVGGPGIISIEYLGKEAGFSNNLFQWGTRGPYPSGTPVADTGDGTPNLVPSPVPATPPAFGNGLALVTPPGGKVFTTGPVASGVLPFYFYVSATQQVVENGHDDREGSGRTDDIAFWFGLAPTGGALPTTGNSVYVLLDDAGGGGDNDHDDMIMRLTVTEVPEPSTWVMMLGGLGLLGFMTRRRMQG